MFARGRQCKHCSTTQVHGLLQPDGFLCCAGKLWSNSLLFLSHYCAQTQANQGSIPHGRSFHAPPWQCVSATAPALQHKATLPSPPVPARCIHPRPLHSPSTPC